MMILSFVWYPIVIIFFYYSIIFVSTQNDASKDQYDKHVSLAKEKLISLQNRNTSQLELAVAWAQLGIFLQARDLKFHSGGADGIETLNAFDNALILANSTDKRLTIEVNHYKGILLKMMGRGEESIQCYDIALSIASSFQDKSILLSSKGDSLVMVGNLDMAIKSYKESFALNPLRLSLYFPLVKIYGEVGNFTKNNWIELVKEIENNKELYDAGEIISRKSNEQSFLSTNDIDNSEVYWALFIACDKAGLYKKAWNYLSLAHEVELSRRAFTFDSDTLLSQTENIKSVFTKSMLSSVDGYTGSDVPVFIVGMMRSGSTLLETMLDAHTEIWGMGEDSVFNVNLRVFRDEFVEAISTGRKKELISVISKHSNYVVRKMTEQAESYISGKKEKISRVVDKMLFNFRNIGFIHLVFPKAVIIHTMRDPMDTLFSCWKNKFDDYGLDWSLKIESLVLQYSNYLEIMHHFRQVLPGRVIDVRYEELVVKPEKILRKIIDRMEISWDGNMLEFHLTNRSTLTNSQQQVRHGLYTKSIGSWRKYSEQLKPMIKLMKKEIKRLRKLNALPYENIINWDLDPDYDYNKIYNLDSVDNKEKRSNYVNESLTYETTVKDSHFNYSISNNLKFDSDVGLKTSNNTLASNDSYYVDYGMLFFPIKMGPMEVIPAKKGDIITINTDDSVSVKRFQRHSDVKSKGTADELVLNEKEERAVDADINAAIKDTFIDTVSHDSNEIEVEISNYNAISIEDTSNILSLIDKLYDHYKPQIQLYKTYVQANVNEMFPSSRINHIDLMKLQELIAYAYLLLSEKNYNQSIELFLNTIDITYSMNIFNFEYNSFYSNENAEIDNIIKINSNDNIFSHILFQLNYINKNNFEDLSNDNINIITTQWFGLGLSYALIKDFNHSIESFNHLLYIDENNINGLKRRAEINQVIGQLDNGINDISKAIILLSNNNINSDIIDCYIKRGIMLYQQRRFISSNNDFILANNNLLKYDSKHQYNTNMNNILSNKLINKLNIKNKYKLKYIHSNGKLWNLLGKSEKELSNWILAIQCQLNVLSINSNAIEAYLELGITLIEVSYWEDGLKFLNKVISLDKNQLLAYGYIGLLYQSLGESKKAITIFKNALKISLHDLQCQYLLSMCLQATGYYIETLKYLTNILEITQSKNEEIDRYMNCYIRRELASYHYLHQYDDITTYNIDNNINFYIKEAHAYPLRSSDITLDSFIQKYNYYYSVVNNDKLIGDQSVYKKNDLFNNYVCVYQDNKLKDRKLSECYQSKCISKSAIDKLVEVTSNISKWIQLNSTGFLPNVRYHRMFGLSVLQIAQTLRAHIHCQHHNLDGLQIPDVMSSNINYYGMNKSKESLNKRKDYHIFGWRDLFDILVKWRAISDPNDIVWWIDNIILPNKDKDKPIENQRFLGDHRIGLNTYINSGVSKVHRYYTYFNKCFSFTKKKLLEGLAYDHRETHIILNQKEKNEVKKSKTLDDLYNAINQPFFVIPSLKSLYNHKNLNGTRITLTKAYPEGYDYSIRSASTPERFIQYEKELYNLFNEYITTLYAYTYNERKPVSLDILKLGLKMFYYWVNFGATTRGSSAIGYIILYASILAIEEEFINNIPEGIQLDWEAMLHETVDSFIDEVLPWLKPRKKTDIPKEYFTVGYINEYDDLCDKNNKKYNSNNCEYCQKSVSQMFRNTALMTYAITGND